MDRINEGRVIKHGLWVVEEAFFRLYPTHTTHFLGRGEYKNREMRNREMPVKKRAIQKYGFSLVTVLENMLSKLLSVGW